MRHVLAIARRELESYFVSPVAYAVVTIVTFVSGLFFSNMLVYYIRQAQIADAQIANVGRSPLQLDVPTVVLSQFFENEAGLLMFAIPLLTMGLITDERRRGTLELLVTSPVRPIELACGKLLGALSLYTIMLLPFLLMFGFLAQGGAWEPGLVVSGLLGLLLLGAAQIALGLFVSSLCENILVSAVGTYGLLLAFQFVDSVASTSQSLWAGALAYISFYGRHLSFTRGVLVAGDVVFFLSFVIFGLFLTQRAIDAIRFKRS